MASPAVAELHSEAHVEQPLDDTVALPLGIEVPPPYEYPPTPAVQAVVAAAPAVEAPFTSLYYSQQGTIMAIACGLAIVLSVQLALARIFRVARSIIEALTFFATSMVAVLVAVYVCDLLIAGPDVLLLHEGERSSIVNFIKDTCLMVFAYFFGTKSAGSATTESTQ